MACPLFLPVSRLARFASDVASLGDLYSGQCAGDHAAPIPIDTLRRCCNEGYARDICPRAAAAESDAIRFLIKSRHNDVIEIAWSIERNHHPVSVGRLHLSDAALADTPLARQARAYAAAFLRQSRD